MHLVKLLNYLVKGGKAGVFQKIGARPWNRQLIVNAEYMSKWDKYPNCIQIYIQILYAYLIQTEISCRYLIFGIGYISIFMRGASHTPPPNHQAPAYQQTTLPLLWQQNQETTFSHQPQTQQAQAWCRHRAACNLVRFCVLRYFSDEDFIQLKRQMMN